jgi:putative thioredoxin
MTQQYIIDVTEATFMQEVLDASQQQPVLVDFWATWCEPCKSLIPILENLAQSYLGVFILAKIDIDQQQTLANQFNVRSVPTVKLFKNGQVVDEFTGVLSEVQIKEILDKHIDRKSDLLMKQALIEYEQGNKEESLTQMGNIIQGDKTNENNIVLYARILLKEGHNREATQWLNSLSPAMKNTDDVSTLFTQLEFIDILETAPDIEILETRIKQNHKDSEARLQLSAHYIFQGKMEQAMEQLLTIVMSDRTYNDDAGRTGLLKLFNLLGSEHPLVSQYRRKLAVALN